MTIALDPSPAEDLLDGPGLDELTELALAADPDQPLDADAVPWRPTGPGGSLGPGLLPDWYMPGSVSRRHQRWHGAVVVVIIAAFLLINGLGLCITYGHLVPA